LQPLLFDEGLPGGNAVPRALSALGWTATAVGDPGAPPRGLGDEVNIEWCRGNHSILVTHDRGKKEREIITVLDQCHVGAIIILTPMRKQPPMGMARALLCAEGQIDAITLGRRTLRHHLRASGKLDSVTKPRR
jgi:hypothetical protein